MMKQITVSLPKRLHAELKKEAEKREVPLSRLVRHVLAERSWRKHRPKKQHWLEEIYAKGKAKRKIKKFEDLFSE